MRFEHKGQSRVLCPQNLVPEVSVGELLRQSPTSQACALSISLQITLAPTSPGQNTLTNNTLSVGLVYIQSDVLTYE